LFPSKIKCEAFDVDASIISTKISFTGSVQKSTQFPVGSGPKTLISLSAGLLEFSCNVVGLSTSLLLTQFSMLMKNFFLK
jgi:hypothetical protein